MNYVAKETTILNVQKAKLWKLGLPEDWLQGESIELKIEGIDEKEMEEPDESLLEGFSALLKATRGYIYGEKETYFPKVKVINITTASEPLIFSSANLLPLNSRHLYGFSGFPFECHRMAAVYDLLEFRMEDRTTTEFGDKMWIAPHHTAVWIAPGLMFSKNGTSPAIPFYLQDEFQILRNYL